jgi:hypothetical protein
MRERGIREVAVGLGSETSESAVLHSLFCPLYWVSCMDGSCHISAYYSELREPIGFFVSGGEHLAALTIADL